MPNENTTTTGLPPAQEEDRINAVMATLPPVELIRLPHADADAHHMSILAVRGLHTKATGAALRALADLALLNIEIPISPSSVSSNDAAPIAAPDITEAGAVASRDDKSGRDEEIHFPTEYDDEASYPDRCIVMPRDVEATFEPFYFFFYGSLQVRSVLRSVCDIKHKEEDDDDDDAIFRTNASIRGWEVKMWGPYPALIPAIADADGEDGRVRGVAWLCEKHEHVTRLCSYETDAYRIAYCDVEVPSADGNGVEILKNARTFVSIFAAHELRRGAFDLEDYQENIWGIGRS
ncbi:hypothetical protein F5B18DRAFT_595724 [Nemania serpens]|nr:hypothetical protein F5B18DRAFT_595724 [Nemania serpens]